MSANRDSMSAKRDADKPAVDSRLETCLTCGSSVHVVGHTTMHYEPVFLAQHNAMAKALALEVDKNSVLQLTIAALKTEVDSLKRAELKRAEYEHSTKTAHRKKETA